MANVRAPATAKKLVTIGILPGANVAKVDIAIPVYLPDFDLSEPNPILSMLQENHTVGALAWTEYTPDDYNAGLAAGQFVITSARKFQLGDITKADSTIMITYKAAGNIKQD